MGLVARSPVLCHPRFFYVRSSYSARDCPSDRVTSRSIVESDFDRFQRCRDKWKYPTDCLPSQASRCFVTFLEGLTSRRHGVRHMSHLVSFFESYVVLRRILCCTFMIGIENLRRVSKEGFRLQNRRLWPFRKTCASWLVLPGNPCPSFCRGGATGRRRSRSWAQRGVPPGDTSADQRVADEGSKGALMQQRSPYSGTEVRGRCCRLPIRCPF